MTAAVRNIYIEQGATWRLGFTYCQTGPDDVDGNPTVGDPYDLTGCLARMQVRTKPNSDDALISIDETDGVTLGGVDGTIELVVTDEKSDALGPLPRNLKTVYDCELEWPSGEVDRLLQGSATISPNVTRAIT